MEKRSYFSKVEKILDSLHDYDKIFIIILVPMFLIRISLMNFTDIISYPYQFPDSWSWLSDGINYAGYNTPNSYRPPLFPLLISFFYRIGMENLIIIMEQVFSLLAGIGVYLLASKLYNKKEIGLYSSILFLTNGYLLIFSAYIFAEIIALTFIIFAFYFFIKGLTRNADSSKNLYLFGLFSGFAFLTQYSGILIIITSAIYLLFQRKTLVPAIRKDLFISAIIFILLSSTWFIFRLIKFGNPLYSKINHSALLQIQLNPNTFFLYLKSSLVFVSIFLILLIIFGILIIRRKINLKTLCLFQSNSDAFGSTVFILTWITVFFVFFSSIYSWIDVRFIIYWIVPIIILSSAGIYHIKNHLQIRKFFIFFILIIIINNITIGQLKNNEFMDMPPPDINSVIDNIKSPHIYPTFLLLNQNREKFLNYNYRFDGGYFANIDPYILPKMGRYINNNSDPNDIVAVKSAYKEGWYQYIIINQISVLTKRKAISADLVDNMNIKFIIFQFGPSEDKIPVFNQFERVNINFETYILYRRIHSS